MNVADGSTEFPGISRNGEISGEIELKLEPVVMSGKTIYSPQDTPHPRGEIVVRRKDGLRTQYWQRPELDAEVWRDGWFHTGDVGQLDYGAAQAPKLKVIDRVKALEEVYWAGDSVWIEPGALEENVFGECTQTSETFRASLMATDTRTGRLGRCTAGDRADCVGDGPEPAWLRGNCRASGGLSPRLGSAAVAAAAGRVHCADAAHASCWLHRGRGEHPALAAD